MLINTKENKIKEQLHEVHKEGESPTLLDEWPTRAQGDPKVIPSSGESTGKSRTSGKAQEGH